MKLLIFIVLFVLLTTTAHAKSYKWVDNNGTVHFSDRPSTEKAKELKVRDSNITVNTPAPTVPPNGKSGNNLKTKGYPDKSKVKAKTKETKETKKSSRKTTTKSHRVSARSVMTSSVSLAASAPVHAVRT